jgi:hypothetical protein
MIHHMKENIVFADSRCFTILNNNAYDQCDESGR